MDNKTNLPRAIMIFLITYFFVGIFVYIVGEYLIYHPPKPPSYSMSDKIIKVKLKNGESIAAKYYENPQGKYTLIYCHGNAEDIGIFLYPAFRRLYNLGFSIFSFDYRGYGLSDGRPSEKNTYEDILAVYRYVTEQLNITEEKIIIYGYSLGAAVAIELAKNHRVGGLILEAPFVSAYRVVTQFPLFPFDRYRNTSKIKRINYPVLVMHGRKDDIVPFWHGKMIFDLANEPKLSLWVDDADHTNIAGAAGANYEEAIRNFLGILK